MHISRDIVAPNIVLGLCRHLLIPWNNIIPTIDRPQRHLSSSISLAPCADVNQPAMALTKV